VRGGQEEEPKEGFLFVWVGGEEEGKVGETHLDKDHTDAFSCVYVTERGGGREGGRGGATQGGEVGGLEGEDVGDQEMSEGEVGFERRSVRTGAVEGEREGGREG